MKEPVLILDDAVVVVALPCIFIVALWLCVVRLRFD
jgi:hypothetical protein